MSDESRGVSDPAPRPVPVPSPRGDIVPRWWSDAYGVGILYKTTLNTADNKQRAQLLAAVNEDCVDGVERVNTDLHMVGYTLSPAAKEVDGELQEWVRCVIHEADGGNVAFGARSIIKALLMIEQLDRPSPWNPPLVRRLRAGKLENGHNWYSLIAPPVDAGGKKGVVK